MRTLLLLLVSTVYLFSSQAFISSKELKSKLNEKNLVVIDVTDKETYLKGHIPKAVNANVGDFRDQVGTYQLMKSPTEIQQLVRSLGINNDSKVVIYGHSKPKELLKSSYIALSLIVNGLKEVSLLDGSYGDWLFENQELTSTVDVSPKAGNFVAKHNPDVLVDMQYVKESIGKKDMIESRSKTYFDGTKQSNGVKRLGHITSSKSSFWKDKFNADETVISVKELESIYKKDNGLKENKEVIVSCTGGLEASMNWFILSQYLGFEDVKLYDASMREWGNREDTPMEMSK